ncbi:MAG TPA: phage regulatory CII family protein [Phycisphaerae bacterium]|nr:phage regulatory CII family protein [Phycisphaerae bacterium]
MYSYEVLKEAADKVGVKALAAELHLSQALVYKWCEPPDSEDPDASGSRNPLDRLRDIVKLTNHVPVVAWLCHQAGGFFVHNPEKASRDIDSDLLQSTQHIVQRFSEMLAEVSASVADDGAISTKEAAKIRAEWEELKTTTESFVVACERGSYRKPRK